MFYIIVNKSAKSGKGNMIWTRIEKVFLKHDAAYKVYETSGPGNARQYVKDIMKTITDNDVIVVVGGDGTLNEAINGCDDYTKVKFGYIPNGSANDFAGCMNIGNDIEQIASGIIENNVVNYVDVGEAEFGNNRTKFVVSAGLGFDAQICAEVNDKRIKNILNTLKIGKVAYGLIGLKLVFTYRQTNALLKIDDNEGVILKNMLFTSIHNQTSEGGGYPFCPQADYNDGLFDTCSVYGMSKLREILMFPLAKLGKHINHKGIMINRGEKICIKTQRPLEFHADGENYGKYSKIVVYTKKDKLRLVNNI